MALSDELRSEISGSQTGEPKEEKQINLHSDAKYNIQEEESTETETKTPRQVTKNGDEALQKIILELALLRASIEGSFTKPTNDNTQTKIVDAFEVQTKAILEKQERNERLLTQVLKENTNFQVQVRQGMQHDLDLLKEQQRGEQYNPILKEIATIYVEYQNLLAEENLSTKMRQNLMALFEQLEDILNDYGAEICRSEAGKPRKTRVSKIIEKIPTADEAQHNTVARSRKPGVIRDRTVLYPEFIDVYIFDPLLKPAVLDSEEKEPDPKDEPVLPVSDRISEEHLNPPQNSSQSLSE